MNTGLLLPDRIWGFSFSTGHKHLTSESSFVSTSIEKAGMLCFPRSGFPIWLNRRRVNTRVEPNETPVELQDQHQSLHLVHVQCFFLCYCLFPSFTPHIQLTWLTAQLVNTPCALETHHCKLAKHTHILDSITREIRQTRGGSTRSCFRHPDQCGLVSNIYILMLYFHPAPN